LQNNYLQNLINYFILIKNGFCPELERSTRNKNRFKLIQD